jgi:hypothetical protein
MTEHVRKISENSYVKLGWALTILGSCMFAAFRVGCMCKEIEALQLAAGKREIVVSDHEKRITGVETWAKVHTAKDIASP